MVRRPTAPAALAGCAGRPRPPRTQSMKPSFARILAVPRPSGIALQISSIYLLENCIYSNVSEVERSLGACHLFGRIPEGSVHGERANVGGLVLGCIDSYDSESRRIFQDFSRSTRFILPRWGVKKQRVFYSPKKIFWQVCETRGEELELLRGPIPRCNLENL